MEILKRNYPENRDEVLPLRFFCSGDSYRFWGLFEADFHLVCAPENGTFFLLGTDRLGRDMFSRITYGARISLTIGLVGIIISFALGIIIGGLAGYYGGWVDATVQRMIEVIRSFPELPLWMALSAVLPVELEPDFHLLRHHRDPGPARLDRAGARGALENPVTARRGLLFGGRTDGRKARTDYRSPPAAWVS